MSLAAASIISLLSLLIGTLLWGVVFLGAVSVAWRLRRRGRGVWVPMVGALALWGLTVAVRLALVLTLPEQAQYVLQPVFYGVAWLALGVLGAALGLAVRSDAVVPIGLSLLGLLAVAVLMLSPWAVLDFNHPAFQGGSWAGREALADFVVRAFFSYGVSSVFGCWAFVLLLFAAARLPQVAGGTPRTTLNR